MKLYAVLIGGLSAANDQPIILAYERDTTSLPFNK